jgi:tRNA threonylcarbamoyladenosine biosynthesis protein TsaB
LKVLALETSTEHCSVALLHAGGEAVRHELAGQRHSELLLPMVEAVLAEAGLALADLDGIAFGAGPGSFTGLRIACGAVQGLALGAGLPVVPVGTLLAMAHGQEGDRVLSCLDARMGEIYHAAYVRHGSEWREFAAPSVCSAHLAPALDGSGWKGVGSGFKAYDAALRARYRGQLSETDATAFPHASAIAAFARPVLEAGQGLPPDRAVPLYVRDRVALKMHEQR